MAPSPSESWVVSHASSLQEQRIEFALGLAHGLRKPRPGARVLNGPSLWESKLGGLCLETWAPLKQESIKDPAAWAAEDTPSESARHEEQLAHRAHFGVLAISDPSESGGSEKANDIWKPSVGGLSENGA